MSAHDDWEPPRGGWGLLLLIILGFWISAYLLWRWVRCA
jgi:hypothetical protein